MYEVRRNALASTQRGVQQMNHNHYCNRPYSSAEFILPGQDFPCYYSQARYPQHSMFPCRHPVNIGNTEMMMNECVLPSFEEVENPHLSVDGSYGSCALRMKNKEQEMQLPDTESDFYNQMIPVLTDDFPPCSYPYLLDSDLPFEDGTMQLFSSDSEEEVQLVSKKRKGKSTRTKRWKPSPQQVKLLEKHFSSGCYRTTPELITAVQAAGEATETQIAVWLKNKLSRQKASIAKQEKLKRQLVQQSLISKSRKKRDRSIEKPLEDLDSVLSSVLEEVELIFRFVDGYGIRQFCRMLRGASQIVCYGIGKEGMIMNRFARNLSLLGFQATSLTDISTPPVSQDDLFIVSCGPNCYSSVSSLALEATRMRAQVVAFTAHKTAEFLYTDNIIRIPAQTLTPSLALPSELYLPNTGPPDSLSTFTEMVMCGAEHISFIPEGKTSVMNMGSSFELGMSIIHASILVLLRRKMT